MSLVEDPEVAAGVGLGVLLEPGLPAGEAARVVLRVLLEALLANEEGAREGRDPELLHDFRVALRRARSALGQIREVFPAAAVERLRAELAWLGQVTGPLRDLDVYLLELREPAPPLPLEVRRDLAGLVAHLRAQRRRELKKLRSALGSRRYRGLIADWRALLEPAPVGEEVPPDAVRPVLEVARERIWRAFRRVIRRGRALDAPGPHAPGPPEAFHELRIACKKLRYLLEFFASLFPAEEVEALIQRLKRLQDNLGAFNDCEVQRHHLERSARELADKGRATVVGLLAMGRLLAGLAARQERERESFAESFAGFASKKNRRRCRRLFTDG